MRGSRGRGGPGGRGGRSRRSGGGDGGGRGRGGGGRAAASGNPSTYKPSVPHKLSKELGLGGGRSAGRPVPDDADDGAAGDNAFGGSNTASTAVGRGAENGDAAHAGPGEDSLTTVKATIVLMSPLVRAGHEGSILPSLLV